MVVDGDAWDHWETVKLEITKTRPLHANGMLGEVLGQTDDTFQAMIKAFLCQYVSKDASKHQVTYIHNHLC